MRLRRSRSSPGYRSDRRTSEHDPMAAYRAAHGLYTRSVEAGRGDVAGPALALLRAFASDSDRVREAIESGARTTPMSPAEPSAPSKVAPAADEIAPRKGGLVSEPEALRAPHQAGASAGAERADLAHI